MGLGEEDFSREKLLLLRRCHPVPQHAFAAVLELARLEQPLVARAERLTARARQVAQLVVRSASNAEVATGLSISVATVKTPVNRILAKHGVRSRLQLAVRPLREDAR